MIYEFQLVGGTERIERSYPMRTVPAIGEKIMVGERVFMRVLSLPEIDAGVGQKVSGYPYLARNLPQGLPGADHAANGSCIIRSQNHEKQFASRHKLKRD